MKKLIKISIVIAISVVLIVAGAFAARSITFGTTATISFVSTSRVFVDIHGAASGGIISGDKNYSDITFDSENNNKPKNADSWEIGTVRLNSGNYALVFFLKFTNVGEKPVSVMITRPVTDTKIAVSVSGNNITGAADTQKTDKTTAAVVKNESITFTYTVALLDYSQSLTLTNFNFNVAITAQ